MDKRLVTGKNGPVAGVIAGGPVKFNRKLATIVGCGKCGGEMFDNVVQVLEIPAVASPNGQALMGEEYLLRCLKCGRLRPMLRVGEKEEEGDD